MSFAPRAEKPKLVVFVHHARAMEDDTGVVHYVNFIDTVPRVACKTHAVTRTVEMQPITCLECLCLNVA